MDNIFDALPLGEKFRRASMPHWAAYARRKVAWQEIRRATLAQKLSLLETHIDDPDTRGTAIAMVKLVAVPSEREPIMLWLLAYRTSNDPEQIPLRLASWDLCKEDLSDNMLQYLMYRCCMFESEKATRRRNLIIPLVRSVVHDKSKIVAALTHTCPAGFMQQVATCNEHYYIVGNLLSCDGMVSTVKQCVAAWGITRTDLVGACRVVVAAGSGIGTDLIGYMTGNHAVGPTDFDGVRNDAHLNASIYYDSYELHDFYGYTADDVLTMISRYVRSVMEDSDLQKIIIHFHFNRAQAKALDSLRRI